MPEPAAPGQESVWDYPRPPILGAWSYPDPTTGFAAVADHIAFYPALFTCRLDDELVTPQPGGFYGGWVTKDLAGPFKGAPGTLGW